MLDGGEVGTQKLTVASALTWIFNLYYYYKAAKKKKKSFCAHAALNFDWTF